MKAFIALKRLLMSHQFWAGTMLGLSGEYARKGDALNAAGLFVLFGVHVYLYLRPYLRARKVATQPGE